MIDQLVAFIFGRKTTKKTEHTKNTITDPILIQAREHEDERAREFREHMARYEEEHAQQERQANSKMFPALRKASRIDYMTWLKGYVAQGREPTHVYDYPFDRWDNFYMAERDFEVIPLYGSSSINIIVPEGIKVSGSCGHNELFFMDGFKTCDYGIVPIFEDTVW